MNHSPSGPVGKLSILKGFNGPIAIWIFLDTIMNQDKKNLTKPKQPTTIIYSLVGTSFYLYILI